MSQNNSLELRFFVVGFFFNPSLNEEYESLIYKYSKKKNKKKSLLCFKGKKLL